MKKSDTKKTGSVFPVSKNLFFAQLLKK